MKKIIDVTGTIQEGMWNYEPPFPPLHIHPMPPVPWAGGPVYCEIFEGLHSQTGTYLETPAHFFGNDNPCTYLLIDVPIEKMVDVPCVVLNIGIVEKDMIKGRHAITVAELEACPNAKDIKEGDAILVGTGWGKYWMDKDYLNGSPFFTKAAMDWLLAKKPCMLGGDSARWENLETPEGFFEDFYAADVLMVGPCVNLEAVTAPRCRITSLPIKAVHTSCTPARVVIVED